VATTQKRYGGEGMRIIYEHELAPDDNPCEDCHRIAVTPITITDAQWDEIGTDWVKSGGHKKWLVGAEGGKFHYEQVKPFSQYLNELIELKREVGQ
jgi:hypothetical protein